VRIRRDRARAAVELLVADGCPGIADVPAALVDSESSRGTFGMARRGRAIGNHFEAFSTPPAGSVMWSSFLPALGADFAQSRVDGLT